MEDYKEINKAVKEWNSNKDLSRSTSKAIASDIERGIYNKFPKVLGRMHYIAKKLMLIYHCEGHKLSWGEAKTLVENDYHKI